MLTSPGHAPGPCEQQRYDSNRQFSGWIDGSGRDDPRESQLRLRAARVTVPGLGGAGAAAALALAADRIHLADVDRRGGTGSASPPPPRHPHCPACGNRR